MLRVMKGYKILILPINRSILYISRLNLLYAIENLLHLVATANTDALLRFLI